MLKRRIGAVFACAAAAGVLMPGAARASTAGPGSTLPVQVVATPVNGLSAAVSVADPEANATYAIDWGDHETSQSATGAAQHLYQYPGTYTITETLSDPSGDAGAGSTSFTTAGSYYGAVGPERILDTRKGIGAPVAKVASGGVIRVKVSTLPFMPPDVTAVAVNLTAVNATATGYVSAYADGTSSPSVSNLNYGVSAPVANSAIVQVGSDGYIDLRDTGSSVDLIADLTGAFSRVQFAGGLPYGFSGIAPTRFVDTRHGIGVPQAKVGAYKTLSANVEGIVGNDYYGPADTGAVSVHVTVTDASASGYLTVYSGGGAPPGTSSLNFAAGKTVSNTLIVPMSGEGLLDVYNSSPGTVDIIVDVTGYYVDGGGFASDLGDPYIPITPYRLVDSRKTVPVNAGDDINALIAGDDEIGSGAEALVMNLTATQGTANGYLTASPLTNPATGQPSTSSVNYTTGQTVPCFTQVLFGDTGTSSAGVPIANVENGGDVQVIADVFGYYVED